MANRNQLQSALHKPYDRILFAKEVLSSVFSSGFSLSSTLVSASVQPNKSEQQVINFVSMYGKIILDDTTEITCYEIVLQPSVRIEQSRVAIQHYVRKLLTAGQAALVNFVSPQNKNVWRLTLVAKDSELTTEGIKEKTTNAKRYTYLLGPSETCKTAAERFETLSTEKQINFQALVNAFSVEKLSKAFFDEYTLHYENFIEHLNSSNHKKSVFKGDEKAIRDFTKKLLGRIVFLYFVQKKGWLGAKSNEYKDGDLDFMMSFFKHSGGKETFYSNYLTELFFNALNNEARSTAEFTINNKQFGFVPFLNGGLFDKEEYDDHLLVFKPKLFHNPDHEDAILTEKNRNHSRGFLDFLNSFNFTVHEDSPDEHIVAVDPEMLGHIFENLLEDNKDKGAFYTPKEIVHYMCQESLTEYVYTQLSNKNGQTAIERSILEGLIKRKEMEDPVKPFLSQINDYLSVVKICDPAIGSGAFPMGLLQEIFAIKELIAYELKLDWKPAEVKENIIQNSIYGVDIEKGAVDIARLRFWLSLVVDEEKPRALPNLDYKIVLGDSLVSKYENEIVEIDWEIKDGTQSDIFGNENVLKREELLKLISKKQKQYFNPNNLDKNRLKNEIRNLKIDILINQLELMVKLKGVLKNPNANEKKYKQLSLIYLQTQTWYHYINKLTLLKNQINKPFDHFDWRLDFPEILNPYIAKENKGFDIVIANPPYIDSETMVNTGNEELRTYLSQKLIYAKGNWDIYIAFFEVGFSFLRTSGNMVFITPDKWISKPFGYELRKGLFNNFLSITEAGRKVFANAKVDSIITHITNYSNANLKINKFNNGEITIGKIIEKTSLGEPYAFDWLFSEYYELIKTIEKGKTKFKEYAECENACATSDAYKLKKFLFDITPNSFSANTYLKVINTGTVGKYISRWSKTPMTYLKDKYNAPVVDRLKFLEAFSNSYGVKSTKPKIIIKGLTLLDGCIDYEGEVIPGKTTLVICKTKETVNDLKLALAIVNSKISFFYIREKYRGSSYNQGINFNPDMINEIPVPKINEKQKNIINCLIDYTINLKSINLVEISDRLMVNYFEQIIDGVLYELYFPELIIKHNREIVKHLVELPELSESMTVNEKMSICKNVFDSFNMKEHPIRVNLFYLNSIPEIAHIEGRHENN